MSGFIKDLSTAQKETLNQFNEYLNNAGNIKQIKADIKLKLQDAGTTTKSTTTTDNGSTMTDDGSNNLTIWGIDLQVNSNSRDIILLKFLRAREFKIDVSKQMLIDCLVWREKFKIDDILSEEFPEYYKDIGEIYKTDKEGRPVMINYYSTINPDIVFSAGVDQFVRWKVQQMEKSIQQTLIPSQWEIEDIVVIHDYKDCSIYRIDPRIKQASNQTITTLQNNYPEFLARKFFINIPWLIEKLFTIFSALASERTKSKFIICSGTYREKLLKYIDVTSIAPKLSGFDDNQLDISNVKIQPQQSFPVSLGQLNDDKTVDWEFCTNQVSKEIGALILVHNTPLFRDANNNSILPYPIPSSESYSALLSIKPKEFNSGSIQLEDNNHYSVVFNNTLSQPIDLYYRISIKSKTNHTTTTTTTTTSS